MKFSIIMPSLNAVHYIDAAIRSIAEQSYANWELIVVDGGSTDGTIDVVKSWTEKEPGIQLVEIPQSSIYEAIFAGFSQAQGQILSWLNTDDLYVADAFSTLNSAFETAPDRQWITGLPSIFDPNGNRVCVYPHVPRPSLLIRKGAFNPNFLNSIQAESTFFKAELFEKLSDTDKSEIAALKLAGDFLLWRKLAKFSSLYPLPHVVGGFRIHGENKSLLQSENYREEVAATGAWCFSRRVAYRIQQAYRFITFTRGFAQAERKNRILNQSLQVD